MSISRLLSRTSTVVGVTALLALGGVAAHAQTTLAASSSVTPPPTVSPFGGTLQASSSATYTATNGGQTLTGRLLSAVYSGGTVNGVFGGSNLDFYYQLFLDSGSAGLVDQSTSISSFSNNVVAVAQTATAPTGSGESAGGSVSAQAQRSGGTGSGLLFDFGNGIPIGGFSQVLVVRSNSAVYTTGGGAAILSGTGVSANTTGNVIVSGGVVASAAPEPGSIALMATGVLSIGGMVLRRRKVA